MNVGNEIDYRIRIINSKLMRTFITKEESFIPEIWPFWNKNDIQFL